MNIKPIPKTLQLVAIDGAVRWSRLYEWAWKEPCRGVGAQTETAVKYLCDVSNERDIATHGRH